MGQAHLRHRHLSSRLYQQLLQHCNWCLHHHRHLHHQTSPPPSQRQYISLDDARSDRHFHERINAVVGGHFPHPWPRPRMVPPEHQCFWFESMKFTYWWDCDDKSMFRVFHMWAGKYIWKTLSYVRSSLVRPLWLANEVWLQLQAFWASEDFQHESSKNKANRVANPTASSAVYHGGSSSIGMHKRKLEAELDRPPKQMELFERCYKKKDDGGWSGPRAAEVAEVFQKMMEDHQSQLTGDDGPTESEASVAMTEQQMWLAAVGERTKAVYSALILRPTVPPGPTPTHHRRHPHPPHPTSEPGHGGPHDPPREDDGRHDGHDAGDASDLQCRTVTAHYLQHNFKTYPII
ncbi:UNVERIFIED_CONTAM: hypothetical protein Slati_3975100 [Sesamum latifolium]|uniref:Uncharacterized protein n=1 Tax=Sesamum latifolium TaxID=2727402 RepID=A0AAW2TQV3_9LAMI